MVTVTYDSKGNITGYYPDTTQYTSIPTPNIEITEAQHQASYSNPGQYTVVNGVFTAATVWPSAITLAQAQAIQIAAIKAYVNNIENSGIPFIDSNGNPQTIPSDIVTGVRFLFAERKAQSDTTFTFSITFASGSTQVLTAAEIIQIPILCSEYMQPYFDRQAALIAQVMIAPTVATVQAVPIS